MDQIDLDDVRLAAGRDYLAALEKLGLQPTGLFWAYLTEQQAFSLCLVTPMLDYVGPQKMSEKLLAAYRAAATPAAIDPFIVRVYSPNQSLIERVGLFLEARVSVEYKANKSEIIFEENLDDIETEFFYDTDNMRLNKKWFYLFRRVQSITDLSVQWKRFSKRVDHIAA